MAKENFLNDVIKRAAEMMGEMERHLGEFNTVPVGQKLLSREQQEGRYHNLTPEDWTRLFKEHGPEGVGRYIQDMEREK